MYTASGSIRLRLVRGPDVSPERARAVKFSAFFFSFLPLISTLFHRGYCTPAPVQAMSCRRSRSYSRRARVVLSASDSSSESQASRRNGAHLLRSLYSQGHPPAELLPKTSTCNNTHLSGLPNTARTTGVEPEF